MHKALLARRAYLNLRTINPNIILLGQVLVNKSLGLSEFEGAVLNGLQEQARPASFKKTETGLFTLIQPAPDCMCKVA